MKRILLAGMLAVVGLGVNAQNILKDGNLTTEVGTKVTNVAKSTPGEWFILNNEKEGATFIEWGNSPSETQYPNAVVFDNSGAEGAISWYKALLGQRIGGLEKGTYLLTFYAKAKEEGASIAAYIKSVEMIDPSTGKNGNMFFMRRDYNQEKQPTASGAQYMIKLKDAGKWTKVSVYYDMGKVVNAISSKSVTPNLQIIDTPDDAPILKDCILSIHCPGKGNVVEIANVTLEKK